LAIRMVSPVLAGPLAPDASAPTYVISI
jgi:hypothetical protein